jgi:hypothetical protein
MADRTLMRDDPPKGKEEKRFELAKKCWDEDESFLALEDLAEFLGGRYVW